MVKITKEALDRGLSILEIANICPNSHNCLWEARTNLFKIKEALPQGCQKEDCLVVIFRKALESESPLLYAEALKHSRFNNVVYSANALVARKRSIKGKKGSRIVKRVYDLHIFVQLVLLLLYSLFWQTKQIPLLSANEINGLKKNFSEETIRQTIQEMANINYDWLEWMEEIAGELLSSQTYAKSIVYLAYLYLKGFEKNQISSLTEASDKEKKEFFSTLEKWILQK